MSAQREILLSGSATGIHHATITTVNNASEGAQFACEEIFTWNKFNYVSNIVARPLRRRRHCRCGPVVVGQSAAEAGIGAEMLLQKAMLTMVQNLIAHEQRAGADGNILTKKRNCESKRKVEWVDDAMWEGKHRLSILEGGGLVYEECPSVGGFMF